MPKNIRYPSRSASSVWRLADRFWSLADIGLFLRGNCLRLFHFPNSLNFADELDALRFFYAA